MDIIFNRRSIRNFKNKEIEKEKIEKILRAAMQAPSAGNQQEWEFLVIKDKSVLNKLSEMSPYSKMIKDSNTSIIILGNKNKMKFPENWQQDLGAVTQNILLQAVYEELGAVWLGVAPLQERMDFISNLFNLPKEIMPFAIVPLGYSDKKNVFVDRWDADKVHFESYL